MTGHADDVGAELDADLEAARRWDRHLTGDTDELG